MPIAAGKLKHRITLLKPNPAETRGGSGQVVEDYVEVAPVWAAIEPLNASEQFRAQQVSSGTTHKLTIRYRGDVLPTWCADYADPGRVETRRLYFSGVRDPEETREYLEITAEE